MHTPSPAFFRIAWLSLLLLVPAALSGQDLTVVGPAWKTRFDPPQTLPAIRGKADLPVSDDLKTISEIGYVVMDVVLDPEGKVVASVVRSSHPVLEKAVATSSRGWTYTPARRGRRGVYAEVSWMILFNPTSAAPLQPVSTPRLLAAEPIPLPVRPGTPPIFADLALDDAGRIVGLKNSTPDRETQVLALLKNWRFAPAMQEGKPVASEIRVPIVPVGTGEVYRLGDRALTKIPVASKRVPPKYPTHLRQKGVNGQVLVEFTVDIEGRVMNAFPVKSSDKGFEEAAVDAVSQWEFAPGWRNGRPVLCLMQVPIVFDLNR